MRAPMFTLTRRALLGLSVAALALGTFGPAPARAALSTDAARAFVQETIDILIKIARDGGEVPAQRAAFREILSRRVAMDAVARSSLGPTWRSLNADQQRAYTEAFKDYIANKYGGRFNEFAQTQMEIVKVTDYGDRGIVVLTQAKLENGQIAQVDWGITERGGTAQIANIVVEGVSLVTSEREIVSAMLEKRGGNVDQLIADLKAGA